MPPVHQLRHERHDDDDRPPGRSQLGLCARHPAPPPLGDRRPVSVLVPPGLHLHVALPDALAARALPAPVHPHDHRPRADARRARGLPSARPDLLPDRAAGPRGRRPGVHAGARAARRLGLQRGVHPGGARRLVGGARLRRPRRVQQRGADQDRGPVPGEELPPDGGHRLHGDPRAGRHHAGHRPGRGGGHRAPQHRDAVHPLPPGGPGRDRGGRLPVRAAQPAPGGADRARERRVPPGRRPLALAGLPARRLLPRDHGRAGRGGGLPAGPGGGGAGGARGGSGPSLERGGRRAAAPIPRGGDRERPCGRRPGGGGPGAGSGRETGDDRPPLRPTRSRPARRRRRRRR